MFANFVYLLLEIWIITTICDFVLESCGLTISLPLETPEGVNVTDHRNCENYFKCSGLACLHCPCPDEQTFNPITLKCDSTGSACVCPVETTTTVSSTTTTKATPKKRISTTTKFLVKDADFGSQNSNNNNNVDTTEKPVSTEVIIISGIVSATVIVIVVIVMGVFCWQRRHAAHQR